MYVLFFLLCGLESLVDSNSESIPPNLPAEYVAASSSSSSASNSSTYYSTPTNLVDSYIFYRRWTCVYEFQPSFMTPYETTSCVPKENYAAFPTFRAVVVLIFSLLMFKEFVTILPILYYFGKNTPVSPRFEAMCTASVYLALPLFLARSLSLIK